MEEAGGLNVYSVARNNLFDGFDFLGLTDDPCCCCCASDIAVQFVGRIHDKKWLGHNFNVLIDYKYVRSDTPCKEENKHCELKWFETTSHPYHPQGAPTVPNMDEWTDMAQFEGGEMAISTQWAKRPKGCGVTAEKYSVTDSPRTTLWQNQPRVIQRIWFKIEIHSSKICVERGLCDPHPSVLMVKAFHRADVFNGRPGPTTVFYPSQFVTQEPEDPPVER